MRSIILVAVHCLATGTKVNDSKIYFGLVTGLSGKSLSARKLTAAATYIFFKNVKLKMMYIFTMI